MSKLEYTHQKVERDILTELMTDNNKMRAYVQLERALHNFIDIMKDIDIQVDIQTKRGGVK